MFFPRGTSSFCSRHRHFLFMLRTVFPRGTEKSYFSGFEIYFQGIKIYFKATEIYFQALEIVLFTAIMKFCPRPSAFLSLPRKTFILVLVVNNQRLESTVLVPFRIPGPCSRLAVPRSAVSSGVHREGCRKTSAGDTKNALLFFSSYIYRKMYLSGPKMQQILQKFNLILLKNLKTSLFSEGSCRDSLKKT